MSKTAAISQMILDQVAQGTPLKEAFDAVLGQGRYEQLAGEIWEAANS